MRVAYVHGFSSSPSSSKAVTLAKLLAAGGTELHVPDFNTPSFERLLISHMPPVLDALDRQTSGPPWILVGSSLGGYVATLWAEQNPTKVSRMILLAPAFDVPSRWRKRHGDDGIAEWRARGSITVADPFGKPAQLHSEFFDDATRLPPWPKPPCETLVIHGTRDDVVPLETSQRFARENANVALEVVDDDHLLLSAVPRVAELVLAR